MADTVSKEAFGKSMGYVWILVQVRSTGSILNLCTCTGTDIGDF